MGEERSKGMEFVRNTLQSETKAFLPYCRVLKSLVRNLQTAHHTKSKRPRLFWKSIDNRKNLLDQIAFKLNIKNPRDWGRITTEKFKELGGGTLLSYYNNTLIKCLKSNYAGRNFLI